MHSCTHRKPQKTLTSLRLQFPSPLSLCPFPCRNMWPSPGRNRNNNNNNNNSVSCSPSKSSSSVSSPLSHWPPTPNPSSTAKSMEDVWKDINLASLQDQPTTTVTQNAPCMILQDFLAKPFTKDPPPTTRVASSTEPYSKMATDFFDSLGPPTATILSLNSGLESFQYLENGFPMRPNPQLRGHGNVGRHTFGSCPTFPFDALGSSSVFPSVCKKRPQENGDNSCDQRHKRKIKNRESAARSRARKQESFSLQSSYINMCYFSKT